MKKRLIYAIATTVSVLFGALFFNGPFFGGSDDSKPQEHGVMSDTAFINMIHGQVPSYAGTGDEIVSEAKSICARLDAGDSAQEIQEKMISAFPVESAAEANYFLVASVTQYCVKYSAKVGPYMPKPALP